MKTEMKSTRPPPAVFQQSRRLRRPRSADTERVRALLNRLQTIVPEAPKDRQLPQVQVIQHVINYICHLQHQVVRHPRLGKAMAAGKAADPVTARLAEERRSKAEKQESEDGMDVDKDERRDVNETNEPLQTSAASDTAPSPSDRYGPSPSDNDGHL